MSDVEQGDGVRAVPLSAADETLVAGLIALLRQKRPDNLAGVLDEFAWRVEFYTSELTAEQEKQIWFPARQYGMMANRVRVIPGGPAPLEYQGAEGIKIGLRHGELIARLNDGREYRGLVTHFEVRLES